VIHSNVKQANSYIQLSWQGAPRSAAQRGLLLYAGVSDETWAQVRKHYDDQIAALVCLVGMINAANRMNVIVRYQGGSYEPGMIASLS
jgi:hypothetical protein